MMRCQLEISDSETRTGCSQPNAGGAVFWIVVRRIFGYLQRLRAQLKRFIEFVLAECEIRKVPIRGCDLDPGTGGLSQSESLAEEVFGSGPVFLMFQNAAHGREGVGKSVLHIH